MDIRANDACTNSRQYGHALKIALNWLNALNTSDEKLSSFGIRYDNSNNPRISACSLPS